MHLPAIGVNSTHRQSARGRKSTFANLLEQSITSQQFSPRVLVAHANLRFIVEMYEIRFSQTGIIRKNPEFRNYQAIRVID